VTKLDRPPLSAAHLTEIGGCLERGKVAFCILATGREAGTPTGRLILNLLGSIARFEREVMLASGRTSQRLKGL
jgi:DNA invertase Pin-like site-specific DNA recombinase